MTYALVGFLTTDIYDEVTYESVYKYSFCSYSPSSSKSRLTVGAWRRSSLKRRAAGCQPMSGKDPRTTLARGYCAEISHERAPFLLYIASDTPGCPGPGTPLAVQLPGAASRSGMPRHGIETLPAGARSTAPTTIGQDRPHGLRTTAVFPVTGSRLQPCLPTH
jgi:hypothetical protein